MGKFKGSFIVLTSFLTLFLVATEGGSQSSLPLASFTADPASGNAGAPVAVQFTDTSTGNPTSWLWDFGDGSTSTDQNPVIAYYLPGTYPVTLTVANGAGQDTVAEDYIINACPPSQSSVMFNGLGYPFIMDAYNDALLSGSNDIIIMLMAGALPEEDLYFDADASIELRGGYDCSFANDYMLTSIPGSLTISSGTLIPSNIVISSPPPCQPGDPNNYPGNTELCDGLDNNCNGLVDDGLTLDNDHDGYTSVGSCGGSADDCNDNDESIHPEASEIINDGIDQDCDTLDPLSGADASCLGCHGALEIEPSHTITTPDETCIGCHPARVSNILEGHYGLTVRTDGNNITAGSTIGCRSCHDSGSKTIPTKIAAVGGVEYATCDTCHENRPAEHVTEAAHENREINNACGQCHTSDTTVLGQPGNGSLETAADVDALHRSDCTLCHAYAGPKIEAALVAQAIQGGLYGSKITCTTCHGADFPDIHAFIGDHAALVNVGTTICGDCHTGSPPLVDAVDPKVHNACTSCHDANGNRISLAIGKTFAAGGDCTTCHGDHFPNHSHHTSLYNDVQYNGSVDTSQTSQQGCAVCHHDYDTLNGTSVGLDTWEAILFEHDLDGTKDGSTNTCDSCHAYDGRKSPPLADVQDAIASGNPATCATCHTDKAPDFDHGIPTSGKHQEHLALSGVSCSNCHDTGNFPYFKSGIDSNGDNLYDRSETNVCDVCHQDAANNPAAGFRDGWDDPDFALDCSGCHASAPATGSHTPHLNLTGCGSCHDGTIANTAAPEQHLDGNIDVYDTASADLGYPGDKAIGSANASCTTSYCHSTVQGGTDPTASPAYVASPTWGTSFTGVEATCTGCHNSGGHVGDASSPLTTGSHAKHLTYRFDQDATCNACHFDWSYTGCTTCHLRQVNHADHKIDVNFKPDFPLSAADSSGTYTGDPAPRTPYGACSSLYCHSPGTRASAPYDDPNVTNLVWGGTGMPTDCTGCHDGDNSSSRSISTGSHGAHVTLYDCSKCHSRTVENSRSLNSTLYASKNYSYGQRYHVDGWVTVAFSSDIATSGTYAGMASPTTYRAPGSAAGSCSNTYCHSDGSSVATSVIPSNTSPDWGTGPLACDGCHSYPPAYESGTPKANSHAAHGGFTCDTCHYNTTTTGDTITGEAYHANQTYDVQAGSGVSFTYVFDSGGSTCSNISCHGGSGAVWGASPNHSGIVTSTGTECENCHTNNALVDADDPMVHDACSTCHDANGTLIGRAADKSAPGDCTTCHGAGLDNIHPDMFAAHVATPGSDYVLVFADGQHDDAMTGDYEVFISCSACHATNLFNIHDNNCEACHSGNPSPYDSLGGAWTGGCQQGGCHTTYHPDTTVSHWTVDDQCNQCHNNPQWDVQPENCANCHGGYDPSDTTPPLTTSNVEPSYIGPARIEFSMKDNGKVGIGTFYSKIDGGVRQLGSSILVNTAGSHTLEFWGVDQAGNEEIPHNTATFETTADSIPPVTTSNAYTNYYNHAYITLTATDNSSLGVEITYYTLDGDPDHPIKYQPGTYIVVPQQFDTKSYTLEFWSEDWAGNKESHHTETFTVYGKGTIRLVAGNSDIDGSPCPGDPAFWADWTIRRGSFTGPVVATGGGSCPEDPNWSGVDDVVVSVSLEKYFVRITYWDSYWGYYDQVDLPDISVPESGAVVRVPY